MITTIERRVRKLEQRDGSGERPEFVIRLVGTNSTPERWCRLTTDGLVELPADQTQKISRDSD